MAAIPIRQCEVLAPSGLVPHAGAALAAGLKKSAGNGICGLQWTKRTQAIDTNSVWTTQIVGDGGVLALNNPCCTYLALGHSTFATPSTTQDATAAASAAITFYFKRTYRHFTPVCRQLGSIPSDDLSPGEESRNSPRPPPQWALPGIMKQTLTVAAAGVAQCVVDGGPVVDGNLGRRHVIAPSVISDEFAASASESGRIGIVRVENGA
jgi:hypothetical protein